MIQRIQSLYLLICTILPIVFIWLIYQNNLFDIILVLSALSSIISCVTIFYYKRRKTQFVLCRLNIFLNFSILTCYYFVIGVFDIVNLIPIICIFLLVAANRAIKKDEDLIKSMDRIR